MLLSYDRPEMLEGALGSIFAQSPAPREVLIVDNRSASSEAVARVAAKFPSARLLSLATNAGFAAGMNAGLRAAREPYVLFTEDDLVLDPGCLAAMMGYGEETNGEFLAGGVMLNLAAGTVRCAGGSLELGGVYRKLVHTRVLDERPYSVSYLPGAFLFCGREALSAAGGFHESFFLYHEDDELCARVRQRGWKITVVPGARVRHHEPPDTASPPWLDYVKARNLFQLYLLRAPLRVWPEFALRYGALAILRNLPRDPRRALRIARAAMVSLARAPKLLRQR